jgi:hypothetical protein
MHDPIKYLLWAGGIGLVTALGCGIYIVWVNAGSRNLALGLGALVGACVIFVLQALFELKGTTTTTDFPVEFTIDYGTKSVRSPRAFRPQAFSGYRNILIESYASTAIAAASPQITKEDAQKITRDMAVLSIVSYLLDEQFDWQLDAINYKTSLGTVSLSQPLSKSSECTSVTVDAVRAKLNAAGNMFAGLPHLSTRKDFCLPPQSSIDITPDTVVLRSLVCEIIFTISGFSSQSTIDPHVVASASLTSPIVVQTPMLPDGSPQYITVDIGARATINYAPLRAQDRNLPKYQKWATRIVDGVASRFSLPM